MKPKLTDIKEIIKGNEHFYFTYYKNDYLYYSFFFDGMECLFPIPVKELHRTQLNMVERPMALLGYVRKAIAEELLIIKDID